ncbi:MAG: acyl-CoA desaturase [Saprospiraceae bacterium]|nr:acyl-CoA desaturase [Saprospiraceae bacterium]
MAAAAPLRFVSSEKSMFYQTLHARVDAYFKDHHLSKFANGNVVIKTFILLTVYLAPFVYMLWVQPSFGLSMALWAVMGVGLAGVGMSIMHDANHGAYSGNTEVNKWVGYTLMLLGGSVTTWKLQHNYLHHTFTNVTNYDDDIADKPGLRLSPHATLKPIHRFQWLHALFIYSLVTLYWVTSKDFLQIFRYAEQGVNKNTKAENRRLLLRVTVGKLFYFLVIVGLPLAVGIPFLTLLAGFLLMHFIGGVILTVIFQLAHAVEETAYPLPDKTGVLENDWAIHQMLTTVNFSRNNKLISWYVGGLNFQVEHHLFPKICHVHYPKIAPIVEKTAKEFHVPYLEHKSFFHALRSHFRLLKKLGKLPAMDDMMG